MKLIFSRPRVRIPNAEAFGSKPLSGFFAIEAEDPVEGTILVKVIKANPGVLFSEGSKLRVRPGSHLTRGDFAILSSGADVLLCGVREVTADRLEFDFLGVGQADIFERIKNTAYEIHGVITSPKASFYEDHFTIPDGGTEWGLPFCTVKRPDGEVSKSP